MMWELVIAGAASAFSVERPFHAPKIGVFDYFQRIEVFHVINISRVPSTPQTLAPELTSVCNDWNIVNQQSRYMTINLASLILSNHGHRSPVAGSKQLSRQVVVVPS